MAFDFSSLDNSCLTLFGESATFQPAAGGSPIPITGITSPAPPEEVMYGTTPGVVNTYFFVRFVDISPRPKRGDGITYGGATYDIADVLVDRAGSALLKLKRNA